MISNEKNLALDNTIAFKEIMEIIGHTRERVFRLVNRELIDMYWEIGRYISEKLSALLREIIGAIICADKDDEVVEIALSRNMYPILHELTEGLADDDEDDGGTE